MPSLDITESEYMERQNGKYCSFESENEKWVEGQRRYIEKNFVRESKNSFILDIACGDGVGLDVFNGMGFKKIVGCDINPIKIERVRRRGYTAFEHDIRWMPNIIDDSFDIVYSSHTLEHIFNVGSAIKEIKRVLKKPGLFFVVLPYPDKGPDDAHYGKYQLGTNEIDCGTKVTDYFIDSGFEIIERTFDSYREPEIWLKMILKN